MTAHLTLAHIWAGIVNSPTSNPVSLAAHAAGLTGAQAQGGTLVANGQRYTLSDEASDYLRRLRRGADRFEALGEKAHRALSAEASRLSKQDARNAKRGRETFTPVRGDFRLLTFTFTEVAHAS